MKERQNLGGEEDTLLAQGSSCPPADYLLRLCAGEPWRAIC